MKIIDKSIPREELKHMAARIFVNMVKAVVDIDRGLLAVDAELHSDLEALLLEGGSAQNSLWGINLYPDLTGEQFVEFDSMINLRPSQNNRSRSVEDPAIRRKIIQWVEKRVSQ